MRENEEIHDMQIKLAEKHAKDKSDIDLEYTKMNLKWEKEFKELSNLMKMNKQKKETEEVRAMVSKNKEKQKREREDLNLRVLKKKKYMKKEVVIWKIKSLI